MFLIVAFALFAFALASARRRHGTVLEEAEGGVRRLVTMARYGLGVLHAPVPAVIAGLLQCLGWLCQLFAVWATMRAFDIHEPLPAAGLVLLLMNVAMLFPLWPGNVGLVQAAVALPLVSYGVPYAKGFAFGIGLQAIEMSVGVGIGLIFLAREGLSYAMLKRMPAPSRPRSTGRTRKTATRRPSKSHVNALASPASCKGVLSALEAAMALAAGMRDAGLEADELPVADGGEGTAEVFAATLGGEWRTAPASDPLGRVVEARYLVLEDGSAVVEAAEVAGLRRLGPGELDPLEASSRGLGEVLVVDCGRGFGTDPRRARRHGDGRRRCRAARGRRSNR